MNLKEIAKEIREILDKRRKDIELTSMIGLTQLCNAFSSLEGDTYTSNSLIFDLIREPR